MVKTLFGAKYGDEIKGYYFPDKFDYKYTTHNETKIRQVNDGQVIDHIESRFPKLEKRPSHIATKYNTLFDFSVLLNMMIRDYDERTWSREEYKNFEVYLDIFSRLIAGPGISDDFNSNVHKLQYTFPGIMNLRLYKTIYVSINLDETSEQLPIKYLLPTTTVSSAVMRSPTGLYINLFRFIIRTYSQDYEVEEKYNELSEAFFKNNVVFIIYKGDKYFTIDMKELKTERKLKPIEFIKNLQRIIYKLYAKSKPKKQRRPKIIKRVTSKRMKMGTPSNSTDIEDVRRQRRAEERIADLVTGAVKTTINVDKLYKIDDIPLEPEESDEDILVKSTDEDHISEDKQLDDDEIDELKEIIRKETNNVGQVLSPNQRRARNKVVKEMGNIMVDGRKLSEILADKESVELVHHKVPNVTVSDKSLLESNVIDIERTYLTKTFIHDFFTILHSFGDEDKSAPLLLKSYKVVDTSDLLNDTITYTCKFLDSRSKTQTTRIMLPKINSDGYFMLNGNKKNLKKQYHAVPIVKNAPNKVIINTIQNKLFLERAGTVLNNEANVLQKLIDSFLTDYTGPKCKIEFGYNIKENSSVITSLDYDELAKKYHRITLTPGGMKRHVFYFNQIELRAKIKSINPNFKFTTGSLPFGINYNDNTVYTLDMSIDRHESIPQTIFKIIDETGLIPNFQKEMNKINPPKRRSYTKITALGKSIPLIVFLGFLYGLQELLTFTKTRVTISPKKLTDDPRVFIRFKDCFMYYDEYPMGPALLLNGLNYMKVIDYNYSDFDTTIPYGDFVFDKLRSRNMLKGYADFKEGFMDPITKNILRESHLPSEFLPVLIYCNSLLSDNSYQKESDISTVRIKGYEAVNIIVYKELFSQYKQHRQNPSIVPFTIPDEAILNKLHKTTLLENMDDINPGAELKTKALISAKGQGIGGLNSSRAFSEAKRGYGQESIGTVAISSVDSSEVGVTKQLVLNPNISSARGIVIPMRDLNKADTLPISKVGSGAELLYGSLALITDPKRQGFAESQTKQALIVKNGDLPFSTNGMDKVVHAHIGNNFAHKAAMDGKIIDIDEENEKIFVEYKDGSKEVIAYGITINRNSAMFLENNRIIYPGLKIGSKLVEGQVIAFNKDAFKVFNKELYYTQGKYVFVAITETDQTDDDSTIISQELASRTTVVTAKRKQITLTPFAEIIDMKNVGDHVEASEPLMKFEDYIGDEDNGEINDMLEVIGGDDGDRDSLARNQPLSPTDGIIREVNIYFTDEPENYSASIYQAITKYKKRIKKQIKNSSSHGITEKDSFRLNKTKMTMGRVNGAIMPEDGVLIEYIISHPHNVTASDKLSINANLKATIGKVWKKGFAPITEEGNRRIDLFQSMIGIGARMTPDIYDSGVKAAILDHRGRKHAMEFLKAIGVDYKPKEY